MVFGVLEDEGHVALDDISEVADVLHVGEECHEGLEGLELLVEVQLVVVEELEDVEAVFEEVGEDAALLVLQLLHARLAPGVGGALRLLHEGSDLLELDDDLVGDLDELNDDLLLHLLHVLEVGLLADDLAVDDEVLLVLVDLQRVGGHRAAGQQVVVDVDLALL